MENCKFCSRPLIVDYDFEISSVKRCLTCNCRFYLDTGIIKYTEIGSGNFVISLCASDKSITVYMFNDPVIINHLDAIESKEIASLTFEEEVTPTSVPKLIDRIIKLGVFT